MTTVVDRLAGVSGNLGRKAPVRAATTVDIALDGLQTVDAVALAEGDRVLVKNHADPVQNGIYTASTGPWSRALDFDGARDAAQGTSILVVGGALYGGCSFYLTTANPVVFGASQIVFAQERGTNLLALPTSLPASPGVTWNNGGVVCVS